MRHLAADLVLIVHLAFILFVVAGGLLVLRWPWLAWVHLPAAVWGVAVETFGWICPLTPLEDHLRLLAGQAVHGGDFVARTLLPLIYPVGLTREVQVGLAILVLAINVAIYARLWRRRRGDRPHEP